MTRKKESNTSVSEEDNTQIQHLLEQYHYIAQDLHSGSNQSEAEAALQSINDLGEASQVALLKALSKEQHADAADVLLAINALSPLKSVRKEARRSLILLEGSKIYPRWQAPTPRTPAFQPLVANAPRFWKGYVTESREEGEIQLVLGWEEGYEYNEVRLITFLLDFWEQGLKDFILETANKRNADARLQQLRARMPNLTITDCTLAEGRRLIEEALAVNTWRGTTPNKEYRHHLPTVNQLILNADVTDEDRGLTFINPHLQADEVVATFVAGWALGDYGLNYDMLSRDSSLRDGLERDDWVERRRAWANEAHPTRFQLGFIREREASTPALWLPPTFGSKSISARKEVEASWALELSDTPLSGTLPEMPLGTAVYKETGRHWFWTSYTLVQEEGVWRIQKMTDEGASAQRLSIAELQQRIKELDERATELMQIQEPTAEDGQEVAWRIIKSMHYDDALIVHLPLDRAITGDAFQRAMGLGVTERALVYLERLANNFAEQHGAVLRQTAVAQESLSEYYLERGMNERAEHFAGLALATLREALAQEETTATHAVLAEMLVRQGGDLDEAESHLQRAKEMASNKAEEATIEMDLGNIAAEREQYKEALRHYLQVADIDPNFEHIWFKIGRVYRNLNQPEDAKAAFERSIEMHPRGLAPYAELMGMYMVQGQFAPAREILERGLRSNPKSVHLLALLSSVYLESNDLRRAEAVLDEAEQIDPRFELVQALREEINRRKKK